MDLLVEKWEAVVSTPGVNIIRIHAEENEKSMIASFYTYLLGIDTLNNDIPVIFESIYHDHDQYTKSLLDELKELIHIWNTSNKDAITIRTEPLNWTPDYSIIDKNNPAYLFIENLNRFSAYLNLGKDTFLVAILKVSFLQPSQFNQWLELSLKVRLADKVKLLIDDSVSHPFYDSITGKYPHQIATLNPQLDMDNAIHQLAAMGRADDPAVQYRKAFTMLTQAIGKRKEAEAKKHADACIEIATRNVKKNSYWIGQFIAVYAALANDQVGYRNYKKAIEYSTKGVDAAEQGKALITDEYVYRKFLAQAIMLRASLYTVAKEWAKAIEDFTIAANHYVYTNDMILALEAFRMTGYCNNEFGDGDAACKALTTALSVSKQIPAGIIKFTTFAGIIEMLMKINNLKYISLEDIEEIAFSVYGKGWHEEIKNWKNPAYKAVEDPSNVVVA
jgi:tetratricopeptide (TPR) repeat protein